MVPCHNGFQWLLSWRCRRSISTVFFTLFFFFSFLLYIKNRAIILHDWWVQHEGNDENGKCVLRFRFYWLQTEIWMRRSSERTLFSPCGCGVLVYIRRSLENNLSAPCCSAANNSNLRDLERNVFFFMSSIVATQRHTHTRAYCKKWESQRE